MAQPASRDAAESSAEIPPPRKSGLCTLLAALERPMVEADAMSVAQRDDAVLPDEPSSPRAIARAPQSSVRRRAPAKKRSKR